MKKSIWFLCVCFFVLGVAPAFAMTIDVWEVTEDNTSDINGWIEAQGGFVSVLEDFEDIDAGWYAQKETGVGTFFAEGERGRGQTAYNNDDQNEKFSRDPYFSIQDNPDSWFGRSNTTTSEGASQWLDSGDITLLTLELNDTSLTNLFFYIQDPADFSMTTMFVNDNNPDTNGANNSATHYTFYPQANNASFFVGISLTDGEVLSTLSWSTASPDDGFGLDDFSTIHNPEPATMLLFGFGLIGIAGMTRRRFKQI